MKNILTILGIMTFSVNTYASDLKVMCESQNERTAYLLNINMHSNYLIKKELFGDSVEQNRFKKYQFSTENNLIKFIDYENDQIVNKYSLNLKNMFLEASYPYPAKEIKMFCKKIH
ncbi:hypothetical protein J3998_12675 [Thiomicrorhabdus sp. 6S2-11]|uniref:Uncharacterized protein n=1 Tax=Thiomicrorhabdus marina TaxID=2818442 RepID=A0ABS3Q7V2_9GAMM|nr:hypothetical protein [Thiomicrorhabdus marina]MBO1928425.1 hypothetical protein [Thiomicrorhabdus marina]